MNNTTISQSKGQNDSQLVKIRDLSVRFDMDRGASRVLNEVDLDIFQDEIIGVVGESGSGKSMLASALLDAVVSPGQVSGNITYYPPDGREIDVLNLSQEELRKLRWEEIAMVFQGAMSSFNPTLRIGKHFEETLRAHDYDVESGMQRGRELIEDLYMDPDRVISSYPHELSGGMKQRALIALSLILEPNLLVMDEPTAALDLLMQRSILHLLEELQTKYDLTMLFITHDLPLVTKLANRLAVLYAFEIAELGTTDEILANPVHPYTRALLKATPNLEAPLSEMQSIQGSAPDPVNIPTGCTYAERCPLADSQCKQVDPGFAQISDNHEAACHHWESAADAVPFANEDGDTL